MWAAIIFISGVSLLIIAWLLLPYSVADIEEPIKILNTGREIVIGQPIIQELKITKPNNEPPTDASRALLCDDGNLVTFAPVAANNLPVGSYRLINDSYILPPKVAVGSECVFIWRQSYKVNPIRAIQVEWRSESFKVKE